jgi:hypothetical protein
MLVIDHGYRIKVLMFNPLAWKYMKTWIYYKYFQCSKDDALAFARGTMLVGLIIVSSTSTSIKEASVLTTPIFDGNLQGYHPYELARIDYVLPTMQRTTSTPSIADGS